jgi:hypothetical protein
MIREPNRMKVCNRGNSIFDEEKLAILQNNMIYEPNCMKVICNRGNSIFDEEKLVTLQRISDDFIRGFMFAGTLYKVAKRFSVPFINADELLDDDVIALQCKISDADYGYLMDKKMVRDFNTFSSICNKHDIMISKRYAAITDNRYCRLTIVEFDSTQFLDGVATYNIWNCAEEDIIHAVFDMKNAKSHKLQIYDQPSEVSKKSVANDILKYYMISDIFNIIWDYIVTICESDADESKDESDDKLVKCVNEIDVVSELITDKFRQTEVYFDRLNISSIFKENINARKPAIKCPSCCFLKENKPVTCVVKLV